MSDFSYKARDSTASYLTEVESFVGLGKGEDEDEIEDGEHEPYFYGYRERVEVASDGTEFVVRTPLTEADLLSPQEGDYIAEDTVHRDVTEDVAGVLRRRFLDEPTVAVWRNLKINYTIPGVTDGPSPDLVVVEGVRDRDRRRKSFPLGKVSGKVKLAMEVVSDSSKKKDYVDLPVIYGQLEIEEYLVVRGEGDYIDDVFDVKLWRRDPQTGKLCPVAPDAQGRFTLKTVGLQVGTGSDNRCLMIWDAATGVRQRMPLEEESWLKARAEKAKRSAKLEAGLRRVAAEAMEASQQARREAEQKAQAAEQKAQEMAAEIERLREQLRHTG